MPTRSTKKRKKRRRRTWRLDQKILSKLRQIYLFSPHRREAIAKGRIGPGEWFCAACGVVLPEGGFNLDHVEPVIPLAGIDSWDAVIWRLFFGPTQILCKPCHASKTQDENSRRK